MFLERTIFNKNVRKNAVSLSTIECSQVTHASFCCTSFVTQSPSFVVFVVPDDIVLTKFSHEEAVYWIKRLVKSYKFATRIEKLAVGEASEEMTAEEAKAKDLQVQKTIAQTSEEERRKNDIQVPEELFKMSSDDSIKAGFKNEGQLRQTNDLLAKFTGRHVKPVLVFVLSTLVNSHPRFKRIGPRFKRIGPRLSTTIHASIVLDHSCFIQNTFLKIYDVFFIFAGERKWELFVQRHLQTYVHQRG